jgi:nitroreductase
MELEAALRSRRMTRRFRDHPVPPDVLERLLRLSVQVPSAGFSQGVDLLVATSAAARARFWAAVSDEHWRADPGASGLLAAPVVVLPVADPSAYLQRYSEVDKAASGLAGQSEDAWPAPYWIVDAAFCALALLLGAHDAGLGALFFRLHRPDEEVLAALEIPAGRRLIGAIALGERAADESASGSPLRRERRPLAEVVHHDHWSTTRT